MLRVLLVMAALTISPVAAQQSAQPSAPVYTAAQAEAGRSAYDVSCSACHLRDLTGSFEVLSWLRFGLTQSVTW
jgi:mono/diheme cytochrome c family protein